jgi:hydrophobe/amphiphile efflux-3 (HAE3) family protein
MAAAVRRPLAAALAVLALALAGGLLALGLEPTAATDTLVGRSSETFKATERYHGKFGDDAVLVLVQQELKYTVLTSDLLRVQALEGCIAGALPKGAKPEGGPNGPCAQLAQIKPVKVVFGPGTFINEAVGQVAGEFSKEQARAAEQGKRVRKAAIEVAKANGLSPTRQRSLGAAAQKAVSDEFLRNTLQLALKYHLSADARPAINNPSFVSQIVFDQTRAAGTPKARFAYIFPTQHSALIQVRLKPGLSEAQRERAIGLIREAVALPRWALPNGKGRYVVTGAPVVLADLTDSIASSIVLLLLAALVVMALTLALVFRARLRMLPLLVALAAVAITFGGLALLGASLTMASIAVVPVLIGLAVDYAIQLQARLTEQRRSLGEAVRAVAAEGAPTVVTAAAATAAGFLVLVLSPVPMVRGFGLLLVAGIVVALICALVLGTAGLALAEPGSGDRRRLPRAPGPARGLAAGVGSAWRGAGELVGGLTPARAVARFTAAGARGAFAAALRRPARVLGVAVALAAIGWAVDTQAGVESDIQKLVPQSIPAVRDLRALQQSTGVGGEVDVVVASDKLTDPAVVRWMAGYQADLLGRFGYTAKRGCGKADLCPAFSLPDLFRAGAGSQTAKQINDLLDAVPAYFSQGVLTRDRHTATLAFGIRLMSIERQGKIIDAMRERLGKDGGPPEGVRADLAGLPVLAAEANAALSSPWRRVVTLLAGLLAVGVVLFAAFRTWRRALVPLIPIALATGWSGLIIFLLRIPLNPMSVTLGALVIAISTEFSVLLSERYRAERLAGHGPEDALARTYASTGRAVLASGATAIAGFAVLVLSDISLLRNFGAVTVVDLGVSLLGVLVVLPSVLLLAERGELLGLPGRALRAVRDRAPRPRRRRASAA